MTMLGMLLLFAAGLVAFVGGVMFLIAAFRVSAMWGLLVLFVPFAGLVFLVKYWEEAKRPFLINLAGSAIAAVAFFMVVGGAVSSGVASMEAEMARQQAIQTRAPARQAETAPTAPVATEAVPEPASAETEPAQVATVADPQPATETTRDPEFAAAIDSATDLLDNLPRPRDAEPAIDYRSIDGRDIERHVGEMLTFVGVDGRQIRGRLVGVESGNASVERDINGGTITIPVELASIREIRTR